MSKFTIYSKDGVARRESLTGTTGNDGAIVYGEGLEYNGSWMGECFITDTIHSAYPVNFQMGDYITYRGEKFVLNYDPSVVKKARRGTYGEGFTYDSIKFNALHNELTMIDFLDYVLGENNSLHYTSLPVFPFYAASIDDYCDRLQANTNRWCEANGFYIAPNGSSTEYWLFLTPNKDRFIQRASMLRKDVDNWIGLSSSAATEMWNAAYGGGTYVEGEKKDISVSISNETIWNSLARIKSDFCLNFINRDRKVIVGSAGLPTSLFAYGKNNGLAEIERVADSEQAVITKLFAYGSEKNLPVRYYANLNASIFGYMYGREDATNNVIYLNVRYSTSYLTTSDGNGKYDVTVKIGNTSYSAKAYSTQVGSQGLLLTISPATSGAWSGLTITSSTKIYFTAGVRIDSWTGQMESTTDMPNNMAVNRLMLPGFPTQSLYAWVIANGGTAVTDSHNNNSYGRAKWTYNNVEYDAFFSKDPYQPYILSVNFTSLGIREATKTFDGSDDTEEIYPTIEGTGLDIIYHADVIQDNGVFAEGEDEPTFDIYLPNFGAGFDLKELAKQGTQDGGTPTIYMKDGYCGAREFAFSDEDVTLMSSGTYSGKWKVHVKREHDDLLDLYFPYSYGVSTGGTATANEAYQVRGSDISGYDGDHYVLTGIPMTATYVNANAQKLLAYSLAFLAKNDYTRYTFTPKVDEIFMARDHETNGNNSIYSKIKEGDMLLFDEADFGIEGGSIFIDTLTIHEDGNNGIPTFDVTLRNDKQVGTMQRIQDKIDSVAASIAAGGFGLDTAQVRELINSYGATRFLSKLNNDTAQGFISFLQGLQVAVGKAIKSDNYIPNEFAGTGFALFTDENGVSTAEIDKLIVRMKAVFQELEVKRRTYSAGNVGFSDAANKVVLVLPMNGSGNVKMSGGELVWNGAVAYRCCWLMDDGETAVTNDWSVDDQARCQTFNIKEGTSYNVSNRYYWRKVLAVGDSFEWEEKEWNYIDLAASVSGTYKGTGFTKGCQTGVTNDIPAADDQIIQFGNQDDSKKERQNFTEIIVNGNNAPAIMQYQGVNDYTFSDKLIRGDYYDPTTQRYRMVVYGDAYIGSKDGTTTYIKYNSGAYNAQTNPDGGKLKIKANVEFTNPDSELDAFVQGHQITYDDDIALLNSITQDLQSQIDGEIDTWFYNYAPVHVDSHGAPDSTVPLTDKEPYKTWYDADTSVTPVVNTERLKHLGDVFYDNSSGYAFRFSNTGTDQSPVFAWVVIQDSAVIKALEDAAKAQDTADHKRRIFTAQPTPPYDAGDLWVNATYPSNYTGETDESQHKYKNDVLKCVNPVPRTEGNSQITTFSINDWSLASKYTDDTYAHRFDYLEGALDALQGSTIIEGGLVLSQLIALRDSSNNVQSGISGIISSSLSGGGIASWYGGNKGDAEHKSEYPALQALGDNARWAKSLFRFDGSGYLASGNISWGSDGKVYIKDIHTLTDDSDHDLLNEMAAFHSMFDLSLYASLSQIHPNQSFDHIYISHANNYVLGNNDVLTYGELKDNFVTVDFFKSLFKLYNGTTEITTNSSLPTSQTNLNIKAMFGFWTEKYLSALGLNPDSGGGGGGSSVLYGLLDVKPNDANNKVYGLDGTADNGKVLTYSTTYNKWIAAPTAETYTLPAATSAALGGIKIGYSASGTNNYAVKLDSSSKAYVTVPSYSLPTASSSTKGGVKVGNTLAISSAVLDLASGVIGTTGTYRSVTVDTYGRVTEGTNPTTLSGYGLTDDANITNGVIKLGSNTITPVTNVSLSGDVLMLTKGGSTSDAFKILERQYTVSYPQATFTTAGWYRIGNITLKAGAGASCLLFLNRVYNAPNNESYVFAITVAYNGGITISQIAGHYNSLLIDKIRVTYVSDNSNYYPNIDIHFKETKASGNGLYATIVGAGHVLATSEVVYEPALDSSESTYTFDCVDGGGTSRNYTVCGTLSVGDSIPLSSTTSKRRIYFGDTSHYIELDSNGYFHFSHGLYSDGFVSALGLNDSGSGGGGGAGDVRWDALHSSNSYADRIIHQTFLPASGVTAGTYTNVTVDTYGRVTAGTNPTTLEGYGISDAYTKDDSDTAYFRLSGGTNLGASSTNSVNIDILTTPANYYQSTNAGVPYITTLPSGITKGFRLWVGRYMNQSQYIFQRLREYGSVVVYERYSNNTTVSWSSWVKVQDNLANYASASYFDSSGNANSALKLTTTSKTAWGRTYWTSGGVPTDISGDISNTGTITPTTTHVSDIGSSSKVYEHVYTRYIDTDSGYSLRICSAGNEIITLGASSQNVGIGTTSPSYKLDVSGTFYASGNSSIGGTLGVTGATTLSSTLAVTGTSTLTGLLTANGNIKTGKLYLYKPNSDDTNAVYLTCDSSHNVHLVNGGFYSDSFVSALGLNSSGSGGGGGGGGVGDVTWELLASNSDTRYIAPSHLIYGEGTSDFTDGTEVLSSYVSDSGFQNATYGGRTYRRSALKMWNYIKSKADSVYLPLSGGTMTGSIVMGTNNYIKGANESNGSIIYFDGTRTIVGSVGATSTAATHIRSITGHATIGTSTTASYTVWDSGNDGASSGLDADLLDGQHGSYYATASDVTTLQGYFDSSGAASKAVQLKTARNIWGQSFDGSAAVKGTLYMISDESGTNVNTSSAKLKFNSNDADGSNPRNSPYIQGVVTGLSGITYGRKRLGFFQCNDTDWGGTYTEALSILPNANIGIGTTSPSNLLDVNGTIGILNSGTEKGKIYSTDSAFAIYSAASTEIDLCYGGDSTKAVVLNSAAFKPYNAATGALDLGTTAARWNGIYGTTLNISSTSTFSNLVTLYRETTTSDDFSAGLTFSIKDTTTGKTYSSAWIRGYQDHASTPNGMNMVIRPGGNLFLGGGEAASAHYALKVGSTTENTYITSDNIVYIQANGNTIANRKGIYIGTSGIIYPCAADTATNAAASLGSSSYRFNEINGTVLNISSDTTLSGHVYMANNKYIYCKDTGSTNRTVLFLNNSNSFCIGYGTATAGYGTYIYGNSIYLKYGTTYSDGLVVHADGYVRAFVGFYSDSYVSALGQNTSSDKRLKDIRGNVTLSIADIANAPSVKYLWKNKDLGLQAGSIAQYWQNVLPECVHEDTDGYLSMEYGVIALLASIATAKKVRDHEKRILELERENERLRTEVEQLKA